MITNLARPRDPIVYICTKTGPHSSSTPRASWDDDEDQDDDEFVMPLPEDDPDWGFDDEEAEPERGDFWFDNDDEEEAL